MIELELELEMENPRPHWPPPSELFRQLLDLLKINLTDLWERPIVITGINKKMGEWAREPNRWSMVGISASGEGYAGDLRRLLEKIQR